MQYKTMKSSDFFETISTPCLGENSRPRVAAFGLRTPYNIGNIIRIADNVGCNEVIFINDLPVFEESKIRKTAEASYDSGIWHFRTKNQFFSSLPKNCELVAIETATNSESIYDTILPEQPVFILGNELQGIEDDVINRCKKVVHIPLCGNYKSMNVSHALAICLFEWQRQMIFKKKINME